MYGIVDSALRVQILALVLNKLSTIFPKNFSKFTDKKEKDSLKVYDPFILNGHDIEKNSYFRQKVVISLI